MRAVHSLTQPHPTWSFSTTSTATPGLRSSFSTGFWARTATGTPSAGRVPSWPIRQFLLKNLDYDGETYTWRMNLDAIRAHYDDITAALPRTPTYEGPALFVRGGASDYVADEDREGIRARFPNAELVTIDGAGHWVHADAPDALAEVVTDFLTEAAP